MLVNRVFVQLCSTTKYSFSDTGEKIGNTISESDLAKVLSKKMQGKINLTSSEKASQSEDFQKAGLMTKVGFRSNQTKLFINRCTMIYHIMK